MLDIRPSYREFKVEIDIDARIIQLSQECPLFIDKIVKVRGIVMRVSAVAPELIKGCYVCTNCLKKVLLHKIRNVVQEPSACDCGQMLSYKLDYGKSFYRDKQVIKIQEVGCEEEPMCFSVTCYEINKVTPGDRIAICGILKAVPVLNTFSKRVKSVFKGHMEMLSVIFENREHEDKKIKENTCDNEYKEHEDRKSKEILDSNDEVINYD